MNFCFWAKKSEKNGILYWLPLYQHLKDTKEVADLLWEHWVSESQKQIIRDSLDENSKEKAKNFYLFLAAIHYIGKATPAFQTKKITTNYTLQVLLTHEGDNRGCFSTCI